MKYLYVFLKVSLISLFFFTTGCLTDRETGTESGSTVVANPAAPPTPPADPVRTICDPFQTNSSQARDRGLVGNLLYLKDNQPRYGSISDFMSNAFVADATIYLDRVYTPTRPFDRGFYSQSGDLVKNQDGSTLYEYFGLRVKSQIQLAANEPAGDYQLALMADDGALLKIPDGMGGEKIIVNDDGTHPTRFSCATEKVHLDHNTKIPISLEYYQGPRFHVALVAMWRPWPDGVTEPVIDPYCDIESNDFFFDSTQDPVAPQVPFYELLSRNWKVLENENYYFPSQATNPCTPVELPLAITNLFISSITRNSVTYTWSTNIAATSQGESKNVMTSVITSTALNLALVVNHSVTITGLLPNTLYAIKALSDSAGGQHAISDERAFRTPR